jgi:CubicO group peptidase (beta-lactamase class C family)
VYNLSQPLGATVDLLRTCDFAGDRVGSQLYVSRYGEPVADIAVGARGDGTPLTTASRLTWLCCSKPVLVIALARVLAALGADEREPVRTFVPEYAAVGKDEVTLAHLLTHTAPYQSLGLRWTDDGPVQDGEIPVLTASSWDAALAAICETPLRRPAGQEVIYTNVSNWHVLAEVLQRLTCRAHDDLIREQVLTPLGMDGTSMYITKENLPDLELAPLWDLEQGRSPVLMEVESGELLFSRWPGVACRGPASDLAKPIECAAGWLCAGWLDPAWRAKLTEPRRLDLADPLFNGAEVCWSLGLCADPVAFGLPVDRRVIGHTGMRSSFVLADLDTGITVAFLSTGMPSYAQDRTRKRRLVRAVFGDLGLDDDA